MRKTKIICTIGPASQELETLKRMIAYGMNVARLNFSHGVYEEHQRRIANVRQASEEMRVPVAIMLDTKGPEIRTGLLQQKKVQLHTGQRFILTSREMAGNDREVSITYPNLPAEISPGAIVLLADGLISLQVEETTATDIICRVLNGGELGERKGVNLPGTKINLPFMSDKDRQDINFGIDNGVDFMAASFVRTAEDVLEIRRILENRDADIDIIAKIESQEGVDNLDEIIKVTDGVMVARGDLGVEIPAEEVPLEQKAMIKKCNQAGKIVIIATQMLESMIVNPRPTRAEVSDVANAIFDGADAIMLSGETAAGKYPVEVVETMARIAARAEKSLPYEEILRQKRVEGILTVADAISYATCATAMNLDASAILTATHTGHTARLISKYRPQAKIVACTSVPKILYKLIMVWGVYPLITPKTLGTDDLFDESVKAALDADYIQNGDLVVLTAGIPTGTPGGTNLLKVHVVGDVLVQGTGIGLQPVTGRVVIARYPEDMARVQEGDIVVVTSGDPSMAPYLEKIKAIVAEEGGLTSDAAIMGLNANLPVVVGARNATAILQEGMLVTVDTPRGKVYKGIARVK